jgi:ABC-2 type transport system permease protein
MTKPRWVIAGKELRGVFTERTILLAVIIQVFVAGFSSFLVLGLSALVDPNALPDSTKPTLAMNDTTPFAAQLRAEGYEITFYRSDAAAMAAFREGEADAVVLQQGPANATDVARLTLVLPDGDLRSTLSLTQLKRSLESYEADLRKNRESRLAFDPLVVEGEARAGSYSFVYTLLIPLLVFLPVVLSGALCADSLTEEVQRGTIATLLSTPATPGDVIEGKLLANVAVTPLLSVAWFGLLALNGLTVPLLGGALILLMSTAIAFLMGLLAAGISLATRDRNKAHVLYAAAMFLLLTVSLVLPASPVNAVALLAAGSATPATHQVVVAVTAAALVAWLGLRLLLKRSASWMAAAS